MKAIIYKPSKTAMQSGRGNSKEWILEFEDNNLRFKEPLMGWTASSDMKQEIKLYFQTKEEAISYAKQYNIVFSLIQPQTRIIKPKSYADNFK